MTATIRALRAALPPSVRQEAVHMPDGAADAIVLLRRLRPTDVETAMVCHRALLRQARRDMQGMGFVDPTVADLLRLTSNVCREQGYEFEGGRWMPVAQWYEQRRAERGVA